MVLFDVCMNKHLKMQLVSKDKGIYILQENKNKANHVNSNLVNAL